MAPFTPALLAISRSDTALKSRFRKWSLAAVSRSLRTFSESPPDGLPAGLPGAVFFVVDCFLV